MGWKRSRITDLSTFTAWLNIFFSRPDSWKFHVQIEWTHSKMFIARKCSPNKLYRIESGVGWDLAWSTINKQMIKRGVVEGGAYVCTFGLWEISTKKN